MPGEVVLAQGFARLVDELARFTLGMQDLSGAAGTGRRLAEALDYVGFVFFEGDSSATGLRMPPGQSTVC